MTESMYETILRRRSVRSFNGKPLIQEHQRAIEDFISSLKNPFNVPVRMELLDAAQHGLSSPVIVGEKAYVAAKVGRVPDCEMAFGYSFEKLCLHACSLGLGTVMLAATLSRGAFERAMDVGDDQVLPLASPIGYPAEKMSMRESMMRKGVKADARKPFESLFFNGSFDKPLSTQEAGRYAQALEAVRWAPSARNAQPWRLVLKDGQVHFFKERTMKDTPLGDVQKVDIGIALAHFESVLSEQEIRGSFIKLDAGVDLPEKMEYMVSFCKDA